MHEFHKLVGEQMRRGRGEVVDGYRMPEEHVGVNQFLRREAARNTIEAEVGPDGDLLGGRITRIDGEPLDRAEKA